MHIFNGLENKISYQDKDDNNFFVYNFDRLTVSSLCFMNRT